jgi:hypothetical protein
MSLYRMTNVPVLDDKRTIFVETTDAGVKLWSAKASEPDNRTHWWLISDVYIGEHMFEGEKREWLKKQYGDDVVFALNRGIELGYAKAQADIRQALGVKP